LVATDHTGTPVSSRLRTRERYKRRLASRAISSMTTGTFDEAQRTVSFFGNFIYVGIPSKVWNNLKAKVTIDMCGSNNTGTHTVGVDAWSRRPCHSKDFTFRWIKRHAPGFTPVQYRESMSCWSARQSSGVVISL
jgi:hypothetical protein